MAGLAFLVIILTYILTGSISQEREIYVDSENGNDTAACINSGSTEAPCKSLDFAFNHSTSSTTYILQSSNYTLENEASFINLTDLAFIGNGSEVFCNDQGVGLAFVNISNLTFSRISFRHCAAVRNSTSINFQNPEALSMFNVSLYFFLCESVAMDFVTVSDSPNATGVVMYDTKGFNAITNSNFSKNSVTGSVAGGGGFYVEFTYCLPGSPRCFDNASSDHMYVEDSNYSFKNVRFTDNIANNEGLNSKSTYMIGYRSNHQSFGRGGGLSLYIKGKARFNTFNFTNCTFDNNEAQWGAGAFIVFHDETIGNTITFNNCEFSNNKCNFTFDSGTAGGGMRIGHYVYSFENVSKGSLVRNQVYFKSCHFTDNSAMYGGGLSISPALGRVEKCLLARPAVISMDHVIFENNTAKFGSALHISRYPFSTEGDMPEVIVTNTCFMNNSGHYGKLLYHKDEPEFPHPEGIGAVYINQVDVTFRGSVLFSNNTETALAVAGSGLDFRDSVVTFEDNEGYIGGALTILGSSYVLINDDTTMTFSSNVAKLNGGAMNVRYIELDNLKTHFNCFVRHADPLLQPDQWKANFTFIDNMDQNGQHPNSIHTTSVLPCAWAGGNGYSINTSEIFCWTFWNYYSSFGHMIDCFDQITSDPGKITLLDRGHIEVVPGFNFDLPFTVRDDHGNNLTNITVFRSTFNGTSDMTSGYFWGGHGSLVSSENSILKLTLKTLGDVIWRTELTVNLLQCPPGFYSSGIDSNNTDCACVTDRMYGGILTCDPVSQVVTMNDQNWIGLVGDEYLVGLCPPGFCKQGNDSKIILPRDPSELAEVICDDHRTEVLCGMCVDGYGPAINHYTFDCVPCDNTTASVVRNVFKYISALYLPLTVLFVLLIFFDIRLTTGPANAFILYSQMVTTTFALNAYGQIPFSQITHAYNTLERIFSVIYGVFNLEFFENFLPPFCLTSDFNVLHVLTLDYVVASFPLIMIILTTVCLKLKELCFSRCVRVSNAIKKINCCKSRNITQALLPAFASFLLLSYHKFSLTSSYLQSVQPLVNRGGDNPEQRVYFAGYLNSSDSSYLLAFCVPSIFVTVLLIIFPILLLGYPLTLFEWCLSKIQRLWKFYPADKIHFFLDTFHGCYKIKMRFFAGVYFLFRLTINTVYALSSAWITQFVVQQLACIIMIALVAVFQPYREKYLNYVDTLIFANLAALNSLGLYLFVGSQNSQNPPKVAFAVQYILSLLPLVYMIGFIIHHFYIKESCFKTKLKTLVNISEERTRVMKRLIRADSDIGNDYASKEWLSQSADEELFARASSSNQYSRSSSPGKSIQVNSNESVHSGPSGTTSSSSINQQSSEGTKYGTMSTGTSNSSTST